MNTYKRMPFALCAITTLVGFLAGWRASAEELPSPALAAAAHAQSTFGTIAGIVTSSAKLPIAGAPVTAVGLDTDSIRTTISGSDGMYSFPDFRPGSYSVLSQAEGYPDSTVSSLKAPRRSSSVSRLSRSVLEVMDYT